MQEDIEKIKAQLLIAETATGIRDTIDHEKFDRCIDPTIVKINSAKPIGHEFLKKAATEWLDKDFADKYAIKGATAEPIKSINVQFTGNALAAGKLVDRALLSLRRPDGSWTQLSAKDEAGATVNIYAGPDKSAKQIRTEVDSKKLHGILKDLYPTVAFRLQRREGLISSQWKPLARVLPQPGGLSIVEWNFELAATLSIDKEQVSSSFRSHGESTSTKWQRI